jgi:hypothetical protein
MRSSNTSNHSWEMVRKAIGRVSPMEKIFGELAFSENLIIVLFQTDAYGSVFLRFQPLLFLSAFVIPSKQCSGWFLQYRL